MGKSSTPEMDAIEMLIDMARAQCFDAADGRLKEDSETEYEYCRFFFKLDDDGMLSQYPILKHSWGVCVITDGEYHLRHWKFFSDSQEYRLALDRTGPRADGRIMIKRKELVNAN
jgi:hypothetical protein